MEHAAPQSFVRRSIFSTDHKVIGKQFLWLGLFWLWVGGAMAMAIRWQLAWPGRPVWGIGKLLYPSSHGVISPATYTALFTNHGTIMIFFAVTPILIGAFGNFCLPLLIGARDIVFPILNMLSFWTMFLASALVLASLLAPSGAAAAGWTMYPPLSTEIGTPGAGQTLLAFAVFTAGVSTLMGAINYLTTVIRCRAPGMTWMRLPLTVWGLWLTSILNALFVPVVAVALLLTELDRLAGTRFFIAAATAKSGGDPMLYQHLFWIFAHPEVYILILPVWGVVSDLLSFFARKPAFAYRLTVYSFCAVTILSGVVYGHHMYTTAMSPLLGKGFMVTTMLISLPSSVIFLDWIGTLWGGALRFQTPMLFALGVVFVFGFGGLTGLYLADIPIDVWLHDSFFVVGHFHLIMGAAVFLGSFAGIYYWFPKMFGRCMNETLGKIHFVGTFTTIVVVFASMLVLGHMGMQRRLYNPDVYRTFAPLRPINKWITGWAYALFTTQILFVINFLGSLWRGRPAPANPWQVGTLEWGEWGEWGAVDGPVVRSGPHEVGRPTRDGRDFAYQTEATDEDAP